MTEVKKKPKEGFVDRISDRLADGRYLVVVRVGSKTMGAYTTSPPKAGATVPIERGQPVL